MRYILQLDVLSVSLLLLITSSTEHTQVVKIMSLIIRVISMSCYVMYMLIIVLMYNCIHFFTQIPLKSCEMCCSSLREAGRSVSTTGMR